MVGKKWWRGEPDTPTSNLSVWPTILQLVWQSHPRYVLDVGPGWGKAGILLKEYVDPNIMVEAVELWAPYITPLLQSLYLRVHDGDIRGMSCEALNAFDMVLMIDVIEHMPKEDGLSLIERIKTEIVISTPRDFFKSIEDPPTERHVSHWSADDFPQDRLIWADPGALEMGAVLVKLGRVK